MSHVEARDGFEVVTVHGDGDGDGLLLAGCTTAVEDGRAWIVGYEIRLDGLWCTRHATVRARCGSDERQLELLTDGDGRWLIDGRAAPHLDGCRDVDLESSALTNALPVHRLGLGVGTVADAPAAYVRAPTLEVERLEQEYARMEDGGHGQRYHYAAPVFDFSCRLDYDAAGLVLTYPGIAVRAL